MLFQNMRAQLLIWGGQPVSLQWLFCPNILKINICNLVFLIESVKHFINILWIRSIRNVCIYIHNVYMHSFGQKCPNTPSLVRCFPLHMLVSFVVTERWSLGYTLATREKGGFQGPYVEKAHCITPFNRNIARLYLQMHIRKTVPVGILAVEPMFPKPSFDISFLCIYFPNDFLNNFF
jgi:hypothetical protein